MTRPVRRPSRPDAAEGLALIKPAVRAQAAYTLSAPPAAPEAQPEREPVRSPAGAQAGGPGERRAAPWHRYPEFVPPALLERLAARYGWRADGILVGNGSNELIQATLVGDARSRATWSWLRRRPSRSIGCSRRARRALPAGPARAATSSTTSTRSSRPRSRERARVVVLNSPNNPTGSALPDGRGRAHSRRDRRAGASATRPTRSSAGPTAVPLLADPSRLVVLRTFSKAMGMAGLRFGFALAHPDGRPRDRQGQAAVQRERRHPGGGRRRRCGTDALLASGYRAHRRDARTVRPSRLRGVAGLTVFPSAANFVLIRCDAAARRGRCSAGCSTSTGSWCAMSRARAELAECLRISVGTPEDMDAVVGGAARDPWRERKASAAMARIGEIRRTTKETDLHVRVDLDGRGDATVRPASGSSTTCSRRWRGTRCSI